MCFSLTKGSRRFAHLVFTFDAHTFLVVVLATLFEPLIVVVEWHRRCLDVEVSRFSQRLFAFLVHDGIET